MSVFFTADFNLRSGWRFVLYGTVFATILLANGALISLTVTLLDGSIPETEVTWLAINAWALLVPASVSLLFMIRFVDRVPLATFGLGFHEQWARDLSIGLAVSALMLGFYGVSSAALGGLDVATTLHTDGFWAPWILTMLILTVSAANEEILFRGYPLQVLMVAIGPWPAIVAMSALFGLGHHLNPNATWVGTVNTFLAGVLLCLAYVRTRSLWFPYGIHIGWNFAIGPIFGFPVSGITMRSFWITEGRGAEWLTGGAYGPEGGMLGTGVMLTAILAVVWTGKVNISETQRSLINQHSETVYAGNPFGLGRARYSEGRGL